MSKIDIRDFSPKELEILEFFAKSLAESPQSLKEHLLNNRLTKEEVRADIEKLQKNGVISQDDLQRAIKELGI